MTEIVVTSTEVENQTTENTIQEKKSEPSVDDTSSTEKTKNNAPSSSKGNLRSQLRRMNTVASTTPLEFQEVSTEMLDSERRKMNIALQQKDAPTFNAKQYQLTEARQVREVPEPEKVPLSKEELYVDGQPNYKKLREHLLKEGKLAPDAALQLIQDATVIFRDEPTLLELEAPFTVCGDIHGQFYDLINLLDNAGDPSTTPYLFLGDYVDRGSFSCEVCFLLLCMKVNNPESVHLIRGNHESRAMTNIHNFKVECLRKYSTEIYDKIMECFDCLPLAALLNCKMIGTFFCVHGGLSPNLQSLDEVRAIDRFIEVPADGPMTDLLWSDPVLEDEDMTEGDIVEFRQIDFVDNVERGIGYFFGYKALTQFLLKNNLISVVRAHEVQQEGCTEHQFTRGDLSVPMAFTVFSAPNYCDYYANKAAYIKFMPNKYEIYQLEAVAHPYWLPDFQNVFAFSIDYVLDSVRTVIKGLTEGASQEGAGGEETEDWNAETYWKKLAERVKPKIKVDPLGMQAESANLSPQEKFKLAKEKDLKFEKAGPITGKATGKSLKGRLLRRHASNIW